MISNHLPGTHKSSCNVGTIDSWTSIFNRTDLWTEDQMGDDHRSLPQVYQNQSFFVRAHCCNLRTALCPTALCPSPASLLRRCLSLTAAMNKVCPFSYLTELVNKLLIPRKGFPVIVGWRNWFDDNQTCRQLWHHVVVACTTCFTLGRTVSYSLFEGHTVSEVYIYQLCQVDSIITWLQTPLHGWCHRAMLAWNYQPLWITRKKKRM